MTQQKINATQNGGWWEELGSTTLGSNSSSISVSIATERKFMKAMLIANGFNATVTDCYLRLNGVSTATYGGRITTLGTSYSTSVINNGTSVRLYGGGTWPRYITSEIDISRPATGSGMGIHAETSITAGSVVADVVAATCISDFSIFTSDFPAVTSISVHTAGGVMSAGSKLVVMGHD